MNARKGRQLAFGQGQIIFKVILASASLLQMFDVAINDVKSVADEIQEDDKLSCDGVRLKVGEEKSEDGCSGVWNHSEMTECHGERDGNGEEDEEGMYLAFEADIERVVDTAN